MELDALLEKFQSKLLLNDERLDDIDAKRKELTRICSEEEAKITAVCAEVQTRVDLASEALKNKSAVEFKRKDEELSMTRDEVCRDSRALSEELDKIMEVIKEDGNDFNIMSCWEKVKHALSASHDDTTWCLPTFHAAKTLANVKASDLGYICTAQFLPTQYQLSLTYPATQIMVAGTDQKAICTVLTSQLFTDMIQANIKFSIKNKACKESVPYCKEECKLSEDKKSFQIAFLVQRSGSYVVTVLLYDQHVVDSPLTITVAESESLVKDDKIRAVQVEKSTYQEKNDIFVKSKVVSKSEVVTTSPSPTADPINSVPALKSSTPATFEASAPRPSMRRPLSATLPKSDPPARNIPSPAPLSSATPPHSSTLGTRSLKGDTPPTGSVKSLLPPGPLNLSSLTPGSRLTGMRMLSIEEGVKEDSLHKPIGMCILLDGNIAVASTFEGKVKIFDPEGKFVTQVISPEPQFDRPSDMVALQSGQFVVRDNTRVQVFSARGNFMKNMWQDRGQDKCYGLAQDKEGRLITIMESRKPRKTDLLFFDLSTGELVKKIEMEDIIANKGVSKCRFLTYELGKLYITDLGLDCVYILDPVTINAKVFGSSGSDPGQFCDPAGLVVDTAGNMIVADSKNHRLCVFSAEGKFVCHVSLSPETRRPSGVALDKERKELFVLNLQGKAAMTKYKLK